MIAFGRRRRLAGLPSIHSERFTHAWTRAREDGTSYVLPGCFLWTCAICDHLRQMRSDEQVLERGRGGCARPGFTGRYEPGDHADFGNMRYVFVRYVWRRRAILHALGRPSESLACDAADLSPVLAGREEAEKRRQSYLKRHPEPTP